MPSQYFSKASQVYAGFTPQFIGYGITVVVDFDMIAVDAIDS